MSVCVACTDRLTAPQAVALVNTIERSLSEGESPERWLGEIWKGDVRLGALAPITLRRDGEQRSYQAVVFERVMLGEDDAKGCGGTRRAAYFKGANDDGAVFFPAGWFDQRLVGCIDGSRTRAPAAQVVTPEHPFWYVESLAGDISPGVVTGPCGFLAAGSEVTLRAEHGISCETTRHRVWLAIQLQGADGTQRMRLETDTTEIMGVRYTIDCAAARSVLYACGRQRP